MLSSIGGDFIATSNESGTIMVIGRDTYDRRKEEGGCLGDPEYPETGGFCKGWGDCFTGRAV